MSLILEALRKSEAERRRGLPPDLHAELPPTPAPRTRAAAARWWWWLPAAIVIAGVAWLMLRPSTPAPTPVASRSPQAEAAPAPGPAQPAPTQSTPALPQRTPLPAVPAPTPAPTRAAETVAPEPSTPSVAADDVATSEPPPAARPAPLARPAPPPTAAPPAARADAGRVLLVGELDGDTRRALPPLKLSMHLWNEDPARRFVILDGQRLGEGDRVGQATITRIEPNGVLLDWNGRGIRIPVR